MPSGSQTICRITGAHPCAVKNWFDGENGPTGRHLVVLNEVAESKRLLLHLLGQLNDFHCDRMAAKLDRFSVPDMLSVRLEAKMSDPRDIIYAAIHSAFVKYPREDDPASHDHWIQPEESAHLTKVVLAELDANGFQIVKKPPQG